MPRDNHNKRKRKRTAVPSPPLPLIQLLQSDATVLHYFQALQQSLEDDVNVWKHRYQTLQKSAQTANPKAKNSKTTENVKTNSPPVNETRPPKSPKESTAEATNNSSNNNSQQKHEAPVALEIDDAMFDDDLSSNSSDSEEEDRHPPDDAVNLFDESDDEDEDHREQQQTRRSQEDSHPDDLYPERDRHILYWLEQAYQGLDRLGIPLIEYPSEATEEQKEVDAEEEGIDDGNNLNIEVNNKDESRGDESSEIRNEDASLSDSSLNLGEAEQHDHSTTDDVEGTKEHSSAAPKRLEDKQVMEEIHRVMHTITRLYTASPEHGPFAKNKQHNEENQSHDRPCWQCSGHPAHEANEILVRSLLVMDTFCDSSSSFKIDKAVNKESARIFTLGLKQRKSMVQNLLLFWKSQILQEGPRTDRATLRESTVLLYDMNQQHSSTTGIVGGPKSLPRLAHVAERSWQSSLLVQLYLSRNEVQSAASLLLEYVQATLPSLHDMEVYPQHPPVLSLLVLESMLQGMSEQSDWFAEWCCHESKTEESQHLSRTLSLVIAVCGSIWKHRIDSHDDRIHDMAWVEFQCFQRLCQTHPLWLQVPFSLEDDFWQHATSAGQKRLEELVAIHESHTSPFLSTSMAILRILLGIIDSDTDESVYHPQQFLPKVEALREIRNRRQWPSLKDSSTPWNQTANSLEDRVTSFLRVLQNGMGSVRDPMDEEERVKILTTILKASHALADGTTALEAAAILVTCPQPLRVSETYRRALDTFTKMAQVPVVRVINLQKRTDRWQCFMNQASCQRLLVVKAVACLSDLRMDSVLDWEFGSDAVDGTGSMVEAQARLEEKVGSFARLNKLVAPQWRPHDLKAFDRGAPNHESLVSTSMSEKACALSHIASWKGALRSFILQKQDEEEHQKQDNGNSNNPLPLLFRHAPNMTRLFKIAGFAQGPPLIRQHQLSPPSPVCVILEDDAILVDHFAERLQNLLAELPRDFHICWLGYSRPKSAPIVPYTKRVGIPTMLWYLTGYIVSEAGVQYLLNSLPVVGPVDSWMGLKTTMNWDNRFGVQVGLGTHGGSGTVQSPSRKELGQILQFRAYCAMKPLVAQRVSTNPNDSKRTNNRNWRHFRDSDIEYSGDKVGVV